MLQPTGKVGILSTCSGVESHILSEVQLGQGMPYVCMAKGRMHGLRARGSRNDGERLLKVPTKHNGHTTKRPIAAGKVVAFVTEIPIHCLEMLAVHHRRLIPNDERAFLDYLGKLRVPSDIPRCSGGGVQRERKALVCSTPTREQQRSDASGSDAQNNSPFRPQFGGESVVEEGFPRTARPVNEEVGKVRSATDGSHDTREHVRLVAVEACNVGRGDSSLLATIDVKGKRKVRLRESLMSPIHCRY